MLKKIKLRQILLSTIIAIMVLMPAISQAATVTSGGGTGGSFTTIERYPDGGWRNFVGNINLHKTAGYSGNLYCTNPFVTFVPGEKTVMPIQSAYPSLTQSDINYVAAGVDYLLNKYPSGSNMEREALAQAFVWNALSGKAGYVLSDFNMTGTGSNLYANAMANAASYANSVRNTAQGNGYVYVSSDGTQDVASFNISYGGYLTLTKITASNSELVKLCPENYSLEGATYRISANRDFTNNAGELVVNADGTANTIYIPVSGKYYAKEIAAPKGYKLDPRIYEIDVVSGQTATLKVADEPLFDPLSLKIQKKAAEGVDKNLSLEGAEYTVKYYKEKTNDITGLTPFKIWVFKTDKNGEIFIKPQYKVGGDELFLKDNGIPVGLFGTYTLEETKAPKGFARTEGILSTQIIDSNSQGQQVNVLKDVIDEEKPQTVSIEVNKKDAETRENKAQGKELGGSIAGAKYDVMYFDAATNEMKKAGTITTDEKGYGKLEGLKPGLYKVIEVIASAGYIVDTEEKEVKAGIKEINTANFNYIVTSLEKPITVEVEKTGYNKQGVKAKIAGAEMQLKKADGTVLDTWTTEKDKSRIFKGLPVGEYVLHEVKSPSGYVKAEDVTFEVKEREDVQKVTMHDDHTKVKISKQDITTEKELPGAELEIIDEQGNTYAKWTSTDKPHFIERMPAGKYTLKETVHPDGYLFANEIKFEVKETGEVQAVVMKDDYTKVEFSKQDITNDKELPGAKLKVTDEKGNVIDEWTSTDKPHMINRLKTGKYILHEEIAPEGYVTASDITFEVKETGEVQAVVMKDDITRTEFTKKDAKTGKLLAGATMQILDSNGKVVKEWVSEEKATTFEKLPVGKYTLHEAKAPRGYELAADIEFEVKDTADVQAYSMEDKLKVGKLEVNKPNTFDNNNLYLNLVIFCITTAIFLFSAKLLCKKEK